MNCRPNRLRSRIVRDSIQTGPTHCKTVEGYSDEMLAGAIGSLSATVSAGRAGKWETERLAALRAEKERRNSKRRGKETAP